MADPIGPGPFDIAIIGAGTAGISAGRLCREKGVPYVIIEARDDVGGRALSDNSFTAPADLGAEWFIYITPKANKVGETNNPLFDIAVQLSLQQPVSDKIYFAGEAVAVGLKGSLPGAWETGRTAAETAIAAL